MSIEGQGHFFTIYFPDFVCFFCFNRPRYQVSVYRTIGSLVNCFRGMTNGFICILLKCTCTNVSSAILSLLSLIEMKKCICDSDFSQNASQNVILRVFDVAFCNAFYLEIDSTHIAMIIPKKFYLKIVMKHG